LPDSPSPPLDEPGSAPLTAEGALYQGALFVGEAHLRKAEWVHAARAFSRAATLAEAPPDRELARGLVHLAAAGYRRAQGEERRATRQRAYAERRLGPFLPEVRELRLDKLLDRV
jgi:hypothetical protein